MFAFIAGGLCATCGAADSETDLRDVAAKIERIPDRYPTLELRWDNDSVKLRFTWIGKTLSDMESIGKFLRHLLDTSRNNFPPLIVDIVPDGTLPLQEFLMVVKSLSKAGVDYILIEDMLIDTETIPEAEVMRARNPGFGLVKGADAKGK